MNCLKITLCVVLTGAICVLAKAPKSAAQYYSDASFQYIENRLPTAEITCAEGLQYYPDDIKLQMLRDRIEESKDEQQKQNQQNNPNGENQEQDKQNSDDQNSEGQNQNPDSGNSSDSNEGNSSASENSANGQSSSSGADSADSQKENPSENPEGNSSSSNVPEDAEQEQPGQMSPQEASQLLKDFDENNGERKPWKPKKGMARPEKDW